MAKGRKTGGRQKGSRNLKTREQVAAIESSGLTPLDYMLSVLRKEIDPNLDIKEYIAAATLRMDAAKAAAPYVHPRLANVELSGNKDKPLNVYVTRFSDAAKPVDSPPVPDGRLEGAGTGMPPCRPGVAPQKR